jgi:hypothetical protein
MIIFPAAGIFADLGGVGVSMFFVTFVLSTRRVFSEPLLSFMQFNRTVISQLTYSFGGSGFAGANGSMMIEVVVCPFRYSADAALSLWPNDDTFPIDFIFASPSFISLHLKSPMT